MNDRYPGYDVLSKRDTLSWNDATRRAVDDRLAVANEPRFLGPEEWRALVALCDRIVPQPTGRPAIPVAAYIDRMLLEGRLDGYRFAELPPEREAWKTGLAAIDAAARDGIGRPFADLGPADRDAIIERMRKDELGGPAWKSMSSRVFFLKRALHDIVTSYYSHPSAWSEMGWAGPASPRGYVRLDADRRDPWEPVEARPGDENRARERNTHVG